MPPSVENFPVYRVESTTDYSPGYYILDSNILKIDANRAEVIWLSGYNSHAELLENGAIVVFDSNDLFVPGKWIIYDNTYRVMPEPTWPDELDFHDIIFTPESTWILLEYKKRSEDLTNLGGIADTTIFDTDVVEIDKDGVELWRWSSATEVNYDESIVPITANTTAFDYAHGNGLDLMPNGNIALSNRNSTNIVIIERNTGKTLKRIGGSRSDYIIYDEFNTQHNIDFHSDTIFSVYDNHTLDADKPSRGARYEIVNEREIRLLNQWIHPDGVNNLITGDIQFLENGYVVVGWGAQIDDNLGKRVGTEYNKDGDIVMSIWTEFEERHYRVTKIGNWVGRPWYPPIIEMAGDALNVSWNGATDVLGYNLFVDGIPVDVLERSDYFTKILFQSSGCIYQVLPTYEADVPSRWSNVVNICSTEPSDFDNDGIVDADDEDGDNDTVSDTVEIACYTNQYDANSVPGDLDVDTICDGLDDDIDGDNVPNVVDAEPRNAAVSVHVYLPIIR